MTDQPAAPVDISRERMEILHSIGSADYLHMALLDEVDLWKDRCANFAGKQELIDRINELLRHRDVMLKALKATDEYLDDDRDTDLHYDIVVAQIRAAIAAAEGTDND